MTKISCFEKIFALVTLVVLLLDMFSGLVDDNGFHHFGDFLRCRLFVVQRI